MITYNLQNNVVLQQIVSSLHHGVGLIGKDGRCLDINPAFCEILKRDKESIVSAPIFDFFASESRQRVELDWLRWRDGEFLERNEIAFQLPDGALAHCNLTVSPILEDNGISAGAIVVLTEISAQQNIGGDTSPKSELHEQQYSTAEHELKRSQNRLKEAHRVARLGSWDVNADGQLYWSDETLEIFGIEREEFEANTSIFWELVHPEDRAKVKRVSDHAWEHLNHYTIDHRIIRPNGEVRHVRESAAVFRDSNGSPLELSGVVQDITEQIQAETLVRQAQKMEAVGQFSGGMAHDFNNILAVILGAAELLQFDDYHNAELVTSIIKSAARGSELTQRLMAYARKQPQQIIQFDLRELVEGLLEMLGRLLGPEIELKFECMGALGFVLADPAHLEDALVNLCTNARDAMPTGGEILIHCEQAFLQGELDSVTGYNKLSIQDSGQGMSAEILKKSVEPFYTTKAAGKGTGLGLAIINNFVRQSAGKLEITSVENSGTTVSIYLPCSKTSELSNADLVENDVKLGARETVLIIDDNEALLELLSQQLEALNYRPLIAICAESAWAQIGRSGSVDVILSDIMLANRERGTLISEEIRARHTSTKVIFMTGYASKLQTSDDYSFASTTVLNKPFSQKALSDALQQVLGDDQETANSH